jgi:hypothetical protein
MARRSRSRPTARIRKLCSARWRQRPAASEARYWSTTQAFCCAARSPTSALPILIACSRSMSAPFCRRANRCGPYGRGRPHYHRWQRGGRSQRLSWCIVYSMTKAAAAALTRRLALTRHHRQYGAARAGRDRHESGREHPRHAATDAGAGPYRQRQRNCQPDRLSGEPGSGFRHRRGVHHRWRLSELNDCRAFQSSTSLFEKNFLDQNAAVRSSSVSAVVTAGGQPQSISLTCQHVARTWWKWEPRNQGRITLQSVP